MILLDTDHVTVLKYTENPACNRLAALIASAHDQNCAIPIVTVEEQMRGWLSEVARATIVRRQISHYQRLADLFTFFSNWTIALFDHRAADFVEDLRRRKVRIGTMDLKIAAIALANDAMLLSSNLRDFRKVPGLRVEDWLHR